MYDFDQARREMVDCQIRTADVTNYSILKAFSRVAREKFVPDGASSIAYCETNIHLGEDRYLLEPRIFAKMLELLKVNSNDLILDIGCGFGYSSAIISEMAELVISLEEEGKLSEGINYQEKVDALIIQGGVQTIPLKIKNQLKNGGRLVAIFINGFKGECRIGIKKENQIHWNHGFDAYVPLLKNFSKNEEFIF